MSTSSWYFLAAFEQHSLSYPSLEVKIAPKVVLIFSGPGPCGVLMLRPIQDPAHSPCRALRENHTSPMFITPAFLWIPLSTHLFHFGLCFSFKDIPSHVVCTGIRLSSFPVSHSATVCRPLVRFFTVISMCLPCSWEKLPINIQEASSRPFLHLLLCCSAFLSCQLWCWARAPLSCSPPLLEAASSLGHRPPLLYVFPVLQCSGAQV